MSLCWLLINCSTTDAAEQSETTKETVKKENVCKFTSQVMFKSNSIIIFLICKIT